MPTRDPERLAVTVQLRRIVMNAPSKLPLHHAVAVKWTRGRSFQGKLPPVPCSCVQYPRAGRGKPPQMELILPPTHQISFEVNVHLHMERTESSRAATFAVRGREPSAGEETEDPLYSKSLTMEKKLLVVVVALIRYRDHTRNAVMSKEKYATVTVDLRDWLRNARLGVPSTFLLPLDDGCDGQLDGSFTVSPVGWSGGVHRMADAAGPSNGGGSAACVDSTGLQRLPIDDAATFAASVSEGGNLHAACAFLKTTAGRIASLAALHGYFSACDRILEEGRFRGLTVSSLMMDGGPSSPPGLPESVDQLMSLIFHRLLCSHGRGNVSLALHAARGDIDYHDVPWSFYSSSGEEVVGTTVAPTSGSTGATGASPCARPVVAARVVPFKLRVAKDKFCPAFEVSCLCRWKDELVVHTAVVSPEAPLVGDAIRLETIMHFAQATQQSSFAPSPSRPPLQRTHAASHGSGQQDQLLANRDAEPSSSSGSGGAWCLAMYVHAAVTSSKVQFMLGSKIQQQEEKSAMLLEQCAKRLLFLDKGRASARSLRASARFRVSLNGQSSSLDPNLWRRMSDTATFPNVDLVLQCLKRLVAVVSQQRPSPAQIHVLEAILGYHRHNVGVALASLNILHLMSRAYGGPMHLAAASRSLSATVSTVVALHPHETFAAFSPFLGQLQSSTSTLLDQRLQAVMASRNLLATLEDNVADVEIVLCILKRLAESGGRVMVDKKVGHTLGAVLTLHLQHSDAAKYVFCILERGRNVDEALRESPGLITAGLLAPTFHTALRNGHESLVERMHTARANLSKFQHKFGAVLAEQEPIFECYVVVEAPYFRMGSLFVTRSAVCIANDVVPLSTLRRVETYWKFLKPAVRLVLIAGAPYEMTLFARKGFLDALRDAGCSWMIHDGEEDEE